MAADGEAEEVLEPEPEEIYEVPGQPGYVWTVHHVNGVAEMIAAAG